MKILLFSDYFPSIKSKIKSALIVTGRCLRIIFTGKKRLKIITFQYGIKHQFDNSYFIIQHEFKNALWYSFSPIRLNTTNHITVLNTQNIHLDTITLTVHGFFSKKNIQIALSKTLHLHNHSFKTSINNFDITLNVAAINTTLSDINVSIPNLKVNTLHPHIQHSTFNPSDYL